MSMAHNVEIEVTKNVKPAPRSCKATLIGVLIGMFIASTSIGYVIIKSYHPFLQPASSSDANAAIDLGEATVDDSITTVSGPAVAALATTINHSLHARVHTLDAVVHAASTAHRRLGQASVPAPPNSTTVKLHVTFEYANRSELPPSATIVDTQDGLLRFALQRPDREDLQPFECDQTSCRASAVAAHTTGRALNWRDGVRWFCSTTCAVVCTYVTKLVREAFVTWACDPLADYICADLFVTNATESGSGDANSEHNFCRQAVSDSCGGELPIEDAVVQMRDALYRHWEREHELGWLVEVGEDFVGNALDYALERLDHVVPDEWGVANSTYYLLNQRWTERTEEVCDTVCSESCSAIIVAIVEFFSSLCYPANMPIRMLDASGLPQLTTLAGVNVGDLVETPNGYEPVIFQGHSSSSPALYMIIRFDSGHLLELSPDHYFKRAGAGGYLLAKDVEVGMAADVQDATGLANPAVVVSVDTSFRDGAYNPYTPSGTIIVANVHASCHSSWLLEGSLVPATHVPSAYQALLFPVRAVHRVAPGFSRAFAEAFDGRSESMGDVSALELLKVGFATALAANAKSSSSK